MTRPSPRSLILDLLSTLRELLRSDLSPDAARAVDGVLTDLRTRYLEVT